MSGITLLRRLRATAYRDQRGLCYWCSREMVITEDDSNPLQCTADHLQEVYAGGKTKHGNIVAACRECNTNRNPETNRSKEVRRLSAGDDTPRSPFEVLKGLVR